MNTHLVCENSSRSCTISKVSRNLVYLEVFVLQVIREEVWKELIVLGSSGSSREARQAGYRNGGTTVSSYGAPQTPPPIVESATVPVPKEAKCECEKANDCPAGPAGPKGETGMEGMPGVPGIDGINGQDAQMVQAQIGFITSCTTCPPGESGPPGPPGNYM